MSRTARLHLSRRSAWSYLCTLAFLVATAGCSSQPGGEGQVGGERAFVERLGIDTLSVEVFTRTADGFQGDLLVRSPVTRVAHYEASLTPEGTISQLMVDWSTPPENPGGPPPVSITVMVEGDSATVDVVAARSTGPVRVQVPLGVIPTLGKTPLSFAVFEQATMQAAASGSDSFPVHFLDAGRARIVPNAVRRVAADTVSVDFFGSPMLAQVDEAGRVLWRSGERTTMKVVVEQVAEVDFEALEAEYAARDARGEGLGVASPSATVEAAVGPASIEIVYNRPAKRGREIWGGLVPFGEVWRTGANAATSFTTDRDLEIAGQPVPAGEYTLYSIFTTESAQLIINKQTGQWGTVYDEGQDLARIELTREMLPEAVERFTIDVEPAADGGVLHLSWDATRFSVPVKVK